MKKILCRFLAMSICFMFVFQGMVYAADVPEETTEQPQTEETTDTEIKEDIPESSIEESTETETEDTEESEETESTETEDTEESEETESEEIAICAEPYGIATYSSQTIYQYTSGCFYLTVQNGSVYGKYQIDVSVGSRCPNGVNYFLSYNMHLIEGTEIGISIAPASTDASAFNGWNPAIPGTNQFYPNGYGINCPPYYGDSYVTMYDSGTADVPARQYVFPITFLLNKPGYHLESADTSGGYQTYMVGYDDNSCSLAVDTNGCGLTNYGWEQRHNRSKVRSELLYH